MPVKRCSWGQCNSDSRYKDRPHMKGVTFRRFPNPKTQLRRCMLWIQMCNRPHNRLNIEKVTRYHFICSKHFVPGDNDPVSACSIDGLHEAPSFQHNEDENQAVEKATTLQMMDIQLKMEVEEESETESGSETNEEKLKYTVISPEGDRESNTVEEATTPQMLHAQDIEDAKMEDDMEVYMNVFEIKQEDPDTSSDEDDTSGSPPLDEKLIPTFLRSYSLGKTDPMGERERWPQEPTLENRRSQQNNSENDIGPFLCMLCDRIFSDSISRELHIKLTHGEEYHKMRKLNTSSWDSDTKNETSWLSSTQDEFDETTEEPIYKCEKCDKAYRLKLSLYHHLKTHVPEGNFQCGICDKTFKSNLSLGLHLRSHSDRTYFVCDMCGRVFKHKASFEKHSLHRDNQCCPFNCQVCNKPFKRRANLQEHLKRHSQYRPFQCEMCSKSFKHRRGLEKHEALQICTKNSSEPKEKQEEKAQN